jgi:FHA domain
MSGVTSHLALYLETAGRLLVFDNGAYVVGRSSQCDISLDGPGISRKHARLVVRGPHVEILDLDSKNGTFVNEQLITGPASLHLGDVLRIGRHSLIRVGVRHLRPNKALHAVAPLHAIAPAYGTFAETTATNVTATAARVLDLVEILAEDLLLRFAEPNTVATITTAIDDLLDGAGIAHPRLNDDEAVRLMRLVRVVSERTNDPDVKFWEASVVTRLTTPDFTEYAAC